VKITMRAPEKVGFEIPAETYRLAAIGAVACLLAIAVIYSRNGSNATGDDPGNAKQAFQQPKDQIRAEATFTPTPKVAEVPDEKGFEIAGSLPLPRRRPVTPGYYYELVRAQGDAAEGEYGLTERRCIPNVDMPQPCYLPERGRRNFPLRRE
jgi:hypothetical protein